MALSIPATSSTDSYVQWGGNAPFVSGVLNVANASVYVILQHALRGQLQLATSDDPVLITPGTGAGTPLYGTPDDLIVGFQIKSAVAGTPAVYSGALYPPNKAGIGAGAAFTGTVSPSGGFTPPATGGAMVTGIIPATGTAQTAGTGFTYTHTNGSGIYVFSFTSAFAASPTVLVSIIQGAGATKLCYPTAVATANGVTITTQTNGGVASDNAFQFVAFTTV